MPGRGSSHNPNVLTPQMLAVLRMIREHDGEVFSAEGGIWAVKGPHGESPFVFPNMTQTIYSLENRGLLERRDGKTLPRHRAPRYLTDAGVVKLAAADRCPHGHTFASDCGQCSNNT